ncbi:MAG: CDP-diacylglycerol--serine O-phosphatidyltransferase [candidate division Zixibacteria bacterium]|nr:CDP-diacylglycerol--serine O-phosphatidyltransferase [candidate division Zixibacteria bacterium]NIR63849.1 CDP-diacylglycerol--serine O-phosphatidyltransferase [candidate division Zixibacteria bacterium]NIS14968.1 CDP-diacylglycerol--serine O-phosphatidyltransferase [candidate division Zixibacteria bacterium]NIS45805.1 CDP-diacylglycerol--serine O-phosphatidyltransferase [candidate division Zixibacteria bacterium]NIT51494.1 CDP-diacylglycerol--serine O-phosphatidyltransferase [candidate divi
MNLKAIFPCAFTVGNLVSGFLAIGAAVRGDLISSAAFICLGAILDFLDGSLARVLKGATRFGREFDSFADFVTFGVAPMAMLYSFLLDSIGFWSWLLSGMFLVAGAFRLIRQNLEYERNKYNGYVGLPITSSGIVLAGFVLISFEFSGVMALPGMLTGLLLGLIVLMISTINFPRFRVFKRNYPLWLKFLLSISFALPLIIKPKIMIFAMIMLYIGMTLVSEMVRLSISKRAHQKSTYNK